MSNLGTRLGGIAVRTATHVVTWRVVTTLLLIVYLIVVREATLVGVPFPGESGRTANLMPMQSIIASLTSYATVGHKLFYLIGNLLIVAPVAALVFLYSTKTRVWLTLAVTLAASLSIEILQFTLRVGRVSDIDDVLLNVVGAIAVYLIAVRAAPRYRGILRTGRPQS